MPQPRPPAPIAAAVAAQGLRVDQVDPDHLFFLQHVRTDGNSYAVDLPARGNSPPATIKYEAETPAANGEAQSALVPSQAPARSGRRVVEEEISPAGVLPWYETRPVDEAYLKFWRQARYVGGTLVLQVAEDKVLRYGMDSAPVRLSDIADWAEKHGWAQKKGGEEVAVVAALGEDGDGVGVGKKKKKVAPIRTLESRERDPLGRPQKKACVAPPGQKVEQGQKEKGEGEGGAGKIKVVKRGEEMLNELPVETLKTMNKETNSSNGHDSKPYSASGIHGVVWPIHIMERPESSFKQKLLRVLRKPFSMVEYKEKLDDATINRPTTKTRQTRGGVKYYNSEHETNQSYFDAYPDLAKQVESTSYLNQLALLRGFYFWLLNISDEDQFRPWSDDFRQYTIIPLE